MQFTPEILPKLIEDIAQVIEQNSEEITTLDQVLGDGDHIINLQRGINSLKPHYPEFSTLNWSKAWQKIGMTLLTTMGGASGSLYGTFFISLSKTTKTQLNLDLQSFAHAYIEAVEAVKKRGKSDAGEKTMLDVLIPVAKILQDKQLTSTTLANVFNQINQTAIAGMESTREMLATKGRASYLQEKSMGHIDAGAKTSQLIISTIVTSLDSQLSP